ncbi:hypothetical protein C349_06586 [Cryptococcus neoformans var. grubii Br795]|nr:hypothetical protein C349_06586 [Cryptococcus neoformans var. grubii Br795]
MPYGLSSFDIKQPRKRRCLKSGPAVTRMPSLHAVGQS